MTSGQPLFVVVQLKARPGSLDAMRDYERSVLPILRRHGGVVLTAFVPESEEPVPDEIHVLRFPSRAHFAAYQCDPEVAALKSLREAAIESTQVLAGDLTVEY